MLDSLLLNTQTRVHLKALLNDPPHALLLVGPAGIGKLTVASAWGSQLAAFVEVIEPDEKGSISIETVRNLYRRTRSKSAEHQVIIIDHAEAMGTDAQNALLKLLEEPRAGVTFILTAPSTEVLLATITSRAQVVQIGSVPQNELTKWAKSVKPNLREQELVQSLFVAQGRPATLKSMLSEEGDFVKHQNIMQTAKQLLGATKYERLACINELVKDRVALVEVLEAMAHMVKLQIQKSGEQRWFKLADVLQECLSCLAQNGNPRAQLLRLFMV